MSPESPRLRPGLVVVRRDDQHLQVGLEPPRRAVLPDVPEVRQVLDDLLHDRTPRATGPGAAAAIARLLAADLLLASAAAPAAVTPATVSVTGPPGLVGAATTALRDAGACLTASGGVRLLLGRGALPRDAADDLMRAGQPHLAAVVTPFGWELGPFVVPGETACLRCVEAARRDHDPRYGVVHDQVARAVARSTAAAPPASAPLLSIATGWIARDLVAYGRGERPSTWSATVVLPETPGPEPVGERRWLRHPHCGCAWDALTG